MYTETIVLKITKMSNLKLILTLGVLISASNAKVVNVKNGCSTPILVNVEDTQYTLLSGEKIILTTPPEWSATISAVTLDNQEQQVGKTEAKLSFNTTQDRYSVSLVNGFNLRLKIVPNGSSGCNTALCTFDLLHLCPKNSQVLNNLGQVIGCENEPEIMSYICPLAIVNQSSDNEQICTEAISYFVLFF
ncbi:hypothetical protein ABEB36_003174 [Hypothenemus hampei]|uniref:Uncharacterized protein n=1 Tax=Hypothenemus hampei TaxID=57062 RepID=A0ABD1F8A3_HYPHA